MTAKMLTSAIATAVCVAALSVAVAASGAQSAHVAGAHTVTLKGKAFHPGDLAIRRGESVTWVWRDGNVIHNVVGRGFQSRVQAHGSFTVRFAHSGTFAYRCTVHPHMTGAIVVH